MRVVLSSLLAFVIGVACTKLPNEDFYPEIADSTEVIWVANEGNFNSNNASITAYAIKEEAVAQQYFKSKNNIELGDVANDIELYGSKVYVIVNNSSTIEILDKNTGLRIKQLQLIKDGINRSPRQIVFSNGKGYVSNFDGSIGVLDTSSLTFEQFVQAGENPDGIGIAKGKLFVANSGGLNFPNYDKTVSVFLLPSMQKDTTLTVTLNPTGIFISDDEDVYIASQGNYSNIKPKLSRIDASTYIVKQNFDLTVNDMDFYKNTAYISSYDFNTSTSIIYKLDELTNQLVTQSLPELKTLNAIKIDPITGYIYCMDANGYTQSGKVYCYNTEWKLLFQFGTGLIPGDLIFIN